MRSRLTRASRFRDVRPILTPPHPFSPPSFSDQAIRIGLSRAHLLAAAAGNGLAAVASGSGSVDPNIPDQALPYAQSDFAGDDPLRAFQTYLADAKEGAQTTARVLARRARVAVAPSRLRVSEAEFVLDCRPPRCRDLDRINAQGDEGGNVDGSGGRLLPRLLKARPFGGKVRRFFGTEADDSAGVGGSGGGGSAEDASSEAATMDGEMPAIPFLRLHVGGRGGGQGGDSLGVEVPAAGRAEGVDPDPADASASIVFAPPALSCETGTATVVSFDLCYARFVAAVVLLGMMTLGTGRDFVMTLL